MASSLSHEHDWYSEEYEQGASSSYRKERSAFDLSRKTQEQEGELEREEADREEVEEEEEEEEEEEDQGQEEQEEQEQQEEQEEQQEEQERQEEQEEERKDEFQEENKEKQEYPRKSYGLRSKETEGRSEEKQKQGPTWKEEEQKHSTPISVHKHKPTMIFRFQPPQTQQFQAMKKKISQDLMDFNPDQFSFRTFSRFYEKQKEEKSKKEVMDLKEKPEFLLDRLDEDSDVIVSEEMERQERKKPIHKPSLQVQEQFDVFVYNGVRVEPGMPLSDMRKLREEFRIPLDRTQNFSVFASKIRDILVAQERWYHNKKEVTDIGGFAFGENILEAQSLKRQQKKKIAQVKESKTLPDGSTLYENKSFVSHEAYEDFGESSKDDLAVWFEKQYIRGNPDVMIAGKYDPIKRIFYFVGEEFDYFTAVHQIEKFFQSPNGKSILMSLIGNFKETSQMAQTKILEEKELERLKRLTPQQALAKAFAISNTCTRADLFTMKNLILSHPELNLFGFTSKTQLSIIMNIIQNCSFTQEKAHPLKMITLLLAATLHAGIFTFASKFKGVKLGQTDAVGRTALMFAIHKCGAISEKLFSKENLDKLDTPITGKETEQWMEQVEDNKKKIRRSLQLCHAIIYALLFPSKVVELWLSDGKVTQKQSEQILTMKEETCGTGQLDVAINAAVQGETAFHTAVKSGCVLCARLLSMGRPNMTTQSKITGRSPLMEAARLGEYHIFKTVLDLGMHDYFLLDKNGQNVFHHLTRNDSKRFLAFMSQKHQSAHLSKFAAPPVLLRMLGTKFLRFVDALAEQEKLRPAKTAQEQSARLLPDWIENKKTELISRAVDVLNFEGITPLFGSALKRDLDNTLYLIVELKANPLVLNRPNEINGIDVLTALTTYLPPDPTGTQIADDREKIVKILKSAKTHFILAQKAMADLHRNPMAMITSTGDEFAHDEIMFHKLGIHALVMDLKTKLEGIAPKDKKKVALFVQRYWKELSVCKLKTLGKSQDEILQVKAHRSMEASQSGSSSINDVLNQIEGIVEEKDISACDRVLNFLSKQPKLKNFFLQTDALFESAYMS